MGRINKKSGGLILERERKYLMPGIQQIASRSDLVLENGRGCFLYDESGKEYIDLFAGVCVCSLGHSHPVFTSAVKEQLGNLVVGSFTTAVRADLLELLAAVAPKNLTMFQFYSSGCEAVEAALRLAKSNTTRNEFISFKGGFHGKTLGAMSLCGLPLRKEYKLFTRGYHTFPYSDCSHCEFNLSPEECQLACLGYLEECLSSKLKGRIAGIVVEPIQGTNGNTIPDGRMLGRLRSLCNQHKILLIVDEIITGFGRTGKMFACDHAGVSPDILVMGKGMANGLPMSAIATRKDIAKSRPFANPSGSSSSFGGNPLCSAGALSTIQTIISEDLVGNAKRTGKHFLNRLKHLQDRYRFVRRVQGMGLLIGIELVEDKSSMKPLNAKVTGELFDRLIKTGIIVMGYSSKIRINPPLSIPREVCDIAAEKIEGVLDSIVRDYP